MLTSSRILLLGAVVVLLSRALYAGTFTAQTTPNPNVHGNTLIATSGTSGTDIWAVGYDNSNNLNESRTLVEHWNGSSWSVVASPNPGATPACINSNFGNYLNGVTALSPTNVWAVGFYFDCTALLKPLIIHWNGSAWSVVANPALLTNDNSALNGIVAVSATNIYAVGYQPASNGAVRTLIEHWNGSSWSVVASPNPSATGNTLYSISVNSALDIWAVGYSIDAATTSIQTMVLHFNGTNWTAVPSPSPLPKSFFNQNVLVSVAASGSNAVTAVGYLKNAAARTTTTLVERWNGSTWSVVPSPNPSTATGSINQLAAVAAVSATDIYAVGYLLNGSTGGQVKDLILHFNGTSWSVFPSPSPSLTDQLNGVFALPLHTNVWAVGAQSPNSYDLEDQQLQVPRTLVLVNPLG